MGQSTHPWLSRARPGSAEPGSGSPGRIGFGPTDPISIPGFLNLGDSNPIATWQGLTTWSRSTGQTPLLVSRHALRSRH
ncbi:hypothetical protein Taro_025606 [Colocasia esculenta]|uniref:Uncharacterized protein n=1 Tax=Colocasia esculenta TaxID=4460 RepID=A0A843V9S4_COLES|nr:hypothetical protein [Colocasia esculenta]